MQIKSKERVSDLSEVNKNKREVNAIPNLTKNLSEYRMIDSLLKKYILFTQLLYKMAMFIINKRIKFIILVIVLIISGCQNELNSNKEQKTILIIGDSIAQGYKLTKGRLYPKKDLSIKNEYGQISFVIEQATKAKVLNNGIPDKTTSYIRDNWEIIVTPETPDTIYMHIGVNDFRKGYKLEEVKSNILWIIQKCKSNEIKLIMANIGGYKKIPNHIEKEIQSINNWLKMQNVELVDYVKWSTDGTENLGYLKPGMFADVIHPSKEGYMQYGQYILDNSTIRD